jgi:hypothetical protein
MLLMIANEELIQDSGQISGDPTFNSSQIISILVLHG